jgi:uncharacterized membrane protein
LLKSRRRWWGWIDILIVLSVVVPLLLLWFLVLAISSISVHEIRNTQESDSRGKGIMKRSIEIGEY